MTKIAKIWVYAILPDLNFHNFWGGNYFEKYGPELITYDTNSQLKQKFQKEKQIEIWHQIYIK